AVAEIDRYYGFSRAYAASDQNLLKYSLERILFEICSEHSVPIWTEWVTESRLAIIMQVPKIPHPNKLIGQICAEVCTWVQGNLPFTVTFGLGDIVDGLKQVSVSYKLALYCL